VIGKLVPAAEAFCSAGDAVDVCPAADGEDTGAACSFVGAARPVAASTVQRQPTIEIRFMAGRVTDVPEFSFRVLAIL
jgi:hypothetical protein